MTVLPTIDINSVPNIFNAEKTLRILSESGFIFYGAGETGKYLYEELSKLNLQPVAFADDTLIKHGNVIGTKIIYSLKDIISIFGLNNLIVVTIFHPNANYLDIKKKLNSYGFKNVISFLDIFYSYPDLFLPYYQFSKPDELLRQNENCKIAFELFDENLSKDIFLSIYNFRLTLDHEILYKADYGHYFPEDLFPKLSFNNCTYFDCGAYDGDSVKKFISRSPDFKQIFAFEPDEQNFEKLVNYIASLPGEESEKVMAINAGVSDKEGNFSFSASSNMGSSLSVDGNTTIATKVLDDFISKHVPSYPIFMKMDIEGEELKALQGTKKIISKFAPNLAISIYHRPEDIWSIPLFLNNINKDYSFFLRQHGEDGMDLVLYAILQKDLFYDT